MNFHSSSELVLLKSYSLTSKSTLKVRVSECQSETLNKVGYEYTIMSTSTSSRGNLMASTSMSTVKILIMSMSTVKILMVSMSTSTVKILVASTRTHTHTRTQPC